MKNTELRIFERAYCGLLGDQPAPIVAIGDRLNYDTISGARGIVAANDGFSEYRYPILPGRPIKSVAIDVSVTGRTAQYLGGASWLRAKITFVGDGEPNTYAKGWVRA